MFLCPAYSHVAANFDRAVSDAHRTYGVPTSVLALGKFDEKSLLSILAFFCNSTCQIDIVIVK